MSSCSRSSIFCISCDVRNPSKKLRNGMRLLSVARCATGARSMTSCTEPSQSIAKPVWRQAITSMWSPNILNELPASERADTWNTVGNFSPAILYMLGIMSSKPCDAVKVFVNAPACNEPCNAPTAPPSDCISCTITVSPKRFLRPCAAHSSTYSAIVDDGVIG